MRGSPFFDGVAQAELRAAGHDVHLPIFYYDGRAVSAVFPARLGALRRMLPDRRFVPARLAPGVGLVGITCFQYVDTDIGPYNELAISIVLHDPPHLPNLPGLGLARGLRHRSLHAWVHHLPVTTEIALASGREFWNYPKFVTDIAFTDGPGELVCVLGEPDAPILSLTATTIDAPDDVELQIFSHLWMDRQPQASEFKLHATRFGQTARPGAATIELAEGHPIARELDAVLLSRRAVQLQHLAQFEGILYGPEHLSVPQLARLQREAQAREVATA